MAQPLTVALPPNLELSGGCIIRVTALDPSTGSEVAGVTVSDITFEVDDRGGVPLAGSGFVPLLRKT